MPIQLDIDEEGDGTLMHHGGVPFGPGASLATILSIRRSQSEIVPSIELVMKTSRQGCCGCSAPNVTSEILLRLASARSFSITDVWRPSFTFPFGDPSSPNNDSREALLPRDPLRLSSYVAVIVGFGGDGGW